MQMKGNTMVHHIFRTPHGHAVRLRCRPGTNDAMMGESSILQDEYQLKQVELGTGVAVDVGAHIGMVAIALALDHPQARILAVEPVPENIQLMRENLDLNGVADRVTIMEGAAAGPTQRSVEIAYNFEGGEQERMHRFIGNQAMPAGARQTVITVPAVRLRDLLKAAGGHIDLLVTDCEGGEHALLAGTGLAHVDDIRGEYHMGWAALAQQLAATHDAEQISGSDGSGGFVARRRTA